MKPRTFTAAVRWLCLLVQVVAGPAWAADLVVCVADDGHVVLELAHSDLRCVTDLARHHEAASAADCPNPGSHRCRDLPLFQPTASNPRPTVLEAATAPQPLSGTTVTLAPSPLHDLRVALAPGAPAVSRSARDTLRTVILRV